MNLSKAYFMIENKVNNYLVDSGGKSVDDYILELGQVEKIKARSAGAKFTNQECMRGFGLSLFSSQTDWGIIQKNLKLIDDSLFSVHFTEYAAYDDDAVDKLAQFFRENDFAKIKLRDDLVYLRLFCRYMKSHDFKIEGCDLFNSYSAIWGNGDSRNVRRLISEIDEFKGMGIALSCEFLKNIGFDVAKPDVHIMRLLSQDRFGFGNWNAQGQSTDYSLTEFYSAIDIIADASRSLGIYQAKMDNVLWLYCARSYCNICGANPRCDMCADGMKQICNIGKKDKTSLKKVDAIKDNYTGEKTMRGNGAFVKYHKELKQLMIKYKGETLKTGDIKKKFKQEYPKLDASFMQPSDHCSNRINKGACDCANTENAIFECIRDGYYRVI